MSDFQQVEINPALDLVLERQIDVPRSLVWQLWTEPEHLKVWFTPKPWQTVACEIDLWPGGKFNTTMQSPEGEQFPSSGCYLAVVPEERLIFTDALLPGFRPAETAFFTAVIDLADGPDGSTRYRAIAMHKDAAGKTQHEEMGFLQGWSTAVDQLVAHAKSLS